MSAPSDASQWEHTFGRNESKSLATSRATMRSAVVVIACTSHRCLVQTIGSAIGTHMPRQVLPESFKDGTRRSSNGSIEDDHDRSGEIPAKSLGCRT